MLMRKDTQFHLQKQDQKILSLKREGKRIYLFTGEHAITFVKIKLIANLCYRLKREFEFIMLQISVFAA